MNAESQSPLFVSTFGSGRSVVCLHGIEAQGVRFIRLAAGVPNAQVIAPDLRGHGRSPKTGPWTVAQQMEDLLPLLSLNSDRPVLLGHSFGGFLAWQLAGIAGDRIAALILVDPAIAINSATARDGTSYEGSIVGHAWPDEAAAFGEIVGSRPRNGRWAGALDLALATRRDPDGLIRHVVAPDAVAACWIQIQEPHVPNSFSGPTLLIESGLEKGRYSSADVIAQIRVQLGDSLEHVVLDATHTIPSDYPDEFAAAVSPFLAKVWAASE